MRSVVQMVTERGGHGLSASALVSRAGLAADNAGHIVATLTRQGTVVPVGPLVVAAAALRALEAHLTRAIGDHHRAQPLSDGLPREEARSRVFAQADDVVFAHVVATLAAAGKIVATDRLALASHRVTVDDADREVLDVLRRALVAAGLQPPDLGAIATQCGVSPAKVEQMAGLLSRQRAIVKIDTLWFSSEALDALKQDVRGWKGTSVGARLDVAAFKDRYGMSRKFAIPLLEYLDRERVTRRMGDARIVL
jgi:selenocysteine-specific elongation factor